MHYVHAMADALRMGVLDREPDVAAEPLGRNKPFRKFARVQADVHFGIETVEESDHLHVQRVIRHGGRIVLRQDIIDSDEMRIG